MSIPCFISELLPEACGDFKPSIITGSLTGEVDSPNYPFDYHNDADCQWLITVDEGSIISLTVLDFNVENG